MMDEKKTVALILAQLEPHEGLSITMQPEEEELTPEQQLHAVAGELVEATRCGDVAAVAEALRAAFLIFDSQPHVEGEHLGEQEEEEEEEETGHEYEPVSHEVRERLGGYREEEEEGHSYGGRTRRRYARGGMVRRYADGGMVESPTGRMVGGLQMPGAVTAGAMSPELSALTGRARMTLAQAGGLPASPGVYTSGPASLTSREALARALAGR